MDSNDAESGRFLVTRAGAVPLTSWELGPDAVAALLVPERLVVQAAGGAVGVMCHHRVAVCARRG